MLGLFRSRPPEPIPAAELVPSIASVRHKPKAFTQIFGTGGMGKTLYLQAVIGARMARRGRVLIVDPTGVLGERGYGTGMTVGRAIAALGAAGETRPFAIRVAPDWEEELTDLFRAAFAAGNLLLAVDEAAEFGGRARLDANFLRIAQKCRNRLVAVATTCLHVTDLDPRVRMNFTEGICFRQTLPDAAERFAVEYAGRDPKVLSPLLLRLERLQYVRATADGHVERGTLADPAK